MTGGQSPASPGASSEVLIGFDVTVDPTRGGALIVDNGGDRGRIDLEPS